MPDYDASREDAAFHLSMASLWSFRQQPQKAREALEQAVALDPSLRDAWLRLGELELQSRAYLKAEEALLRAVAIDPADPLAYRWLGRLHWQQRQPDLARRLYDQAASLRVPDGLFSEELGNVWKPHNRMAAAEYYRSAISQDGGDRVALVANYALTLKELNAWSAAEQVLRFGAASFPEAEAFPLLMGEVLLEQGRWLDAEPYFQHALRIAPHTAQAYYGLARLAFDQDQLPHAVSYLRAGLRYDPYHREALDLLHQIQHRGM
jgi:tetratricopeptide (TPR) repeat protein